ncbi:hypothetical protein M231_06839 [Tremella mesenterica]|uniref:Uncharacterized protein n=1 Tax=Tremella mesenterica TaxID=5217 RepID=A0A4Q1BAV3_TREME|nr:hypothetical protein M231_06839 [Tremella mesenterica]
MRREAPPDATNSTTAVALTATQRTTWLDWANKERKARSTLIFTISPGLAAQVEDLWSAQEIWARITAQHQVKTTARRNDLNQRISLLCLVENANFDTMHTHLETFSELVAEALGAGAHIDDGDRSERFLLSLGCDFAPLCQQWDLRPDTQKSWDHLVTAYHSIADTRRLEQEMENHTQQAISAVLHLRCCQRHVRPFPICQSTPVSRRRKQRGYVHHGMSPGPWYPSYPSASSDSLSTPGNMLAQYPTSFDPYEQYFDIQQSSPPEQMETSPFSEDTSFTLGPSPPLNEIVTSYHHDASDDLRLGGPSLTSDGRKPTPPPSTNSGTVTSDSRFCGPPLTSISKKPILSHLDNNQIENEHLRFHDAPSTSPTTTQTSPMRQQRRVKSVRMSGHEIDEDYRRKASANNLMGIELSQYKDDDQRIFLSTTRMRAMGVPPHVLDMSMNRWSLRLTAECLESIGHLEVTKEDGRLDYRPSLSKHCRATSIIMRAVFKLVLFECGRTPETTKEEKKDVLESLARDEIRIQAESAFRYLMTELANDTRFPLLRVSELKMYPFSGDAMSVPVWQIE